MSAMQELTISQSEAAVELQRLTAEKSGLQGQLAEIKAACCVRIANDKYHRLQRERAGLVSRLSEIEREISAVKARRLITDTATRVQRDEFFFDVRPLTKMRDHWHEFSMNPENHQKAREVAWKVSQELRGLLQDFFKRGPNGDNAENGKATP